jgi:hypothetical protein
VGAVRQATPSGLSNLQILIPAVGFCWRINYAHFMFHLKVLKDDLLVHSETALMKKLKVVFLVI